MIQRIEGNQCQIGDSELSTFLTKETMRQVKQIHLSGNHITDNGVLTLGEIIQNCSQLEVLDLSWNQITDRGVVSLLYLLPRSVIDLDLEGNTINNLEPIADLLTNDRLEALDLSSTGIDDRGASILARGIRKSKKLKYLNLYGNRITDRGVLLLADALAASLTVRNKSGIDCFILDHNRITDHGRREFRRIIRTSDHPVDRIYF